jgi:hypothetical protein
MPLPTEAPAAAHAIVATFRVSDTVLVFDPTVGRTVHVPNPDAHPDLNVTVGGDLVYGDGSPVADEDIPDYVLELLAKKRAVKPVGPAPQQKLTMAEVMLGAGVDSKTGAVEAPRGTAVPVEQTATGVRKRK